VRFCFRHWSLAVLQSVQLLYTLPTQIDVLAIFVVCQLTNADH